MLMPGTELEALVRAYIAPMTSIRGRRMQRLLLREFADFDHVWAASTQDGAPALLALAEDGRVAVCCSDGRGPAASVFSTRLAGAALSTRCDLLKDSLPVLGWTLHHPALAHAGGAFTVSGTGMAVAEQRRVTALLRRLGL
jgi:hypothetical protein